MICMMKKKKRGSRDYVSAILIILIVMLGLAAVVVQNALTKRAWRLRLSAIDRLEGVGIDESRRKGLKGLPSAGVLW